MSDLNGARIGRERAERVLAARKVAIGRSRLYNYIHVAEADQYTGEPTKKDTKDGDRSIQQRRRE